MDSSSAARDFRRTIFVTAFLVVACNNESDSRTTAPAQERPVSAVARSETSLSLGATNPASLEGSLDSGPEYDADWVRGWAIDNEAKPVSPSQQYSINVDIRFANASGATPPGCADRLRIPASHSRPDVQAAKGLAGAAVGFDLYVPIECRDATSVTVHALSFTNPDGVYRKIGQRSGLKFRKIPLMAKTTATLYAVHHVKEFGRFGINRIAYDGNYEYLYNETTGAKGGTLAPVASYLAPRSFGVEESLFGGNSPSVYFTSGRAITTMPADLERGTFNPYCFYSLSTDQINTRYPRLKSSGLDRGTKCAYFQSEASYFEKGLAKQLGHVIQKDGVYPHEQLIRFAYQQAKALIGANIDVLLIDNSNLPVYSLTNLVGSDEEQTLVPIDRFVEAMYHVYWRSKLCADNGPNSDWCKWGFGLPKPPPKIAFFQSLASDTRPYLADRLFKLVNSVHLQDLFFKYDGKKVFFYVEPDESDIHDARRPDSFAIMDLWREGYLPVPMWTHVSANGSVNTSNVTRTDFVSTCAKATKAGSGDTRLYPTSSAATDEDCLLHIPIFTPIGRTAAIGPAYLVPGGLSSQTYANSGFNKGLTLERMYRAVQSQNINFLLIGSWNQHGSQQEILLGAPGEFGIGTNMFGTYVDFTECAGDPNFTECNRKEIAYKLAAKFDLAQWRGLPTGFGVVSDLAWASNPFSGKTYRECAEEADRSKLKGSQLVDRMFACTAQLRGWLQVILGTNTCTLERSPNGYQQLKLPNLECFQKHIEQDYSTRSLDFKREHLSRQFAHSYDTYISEYTPDFEPTFAAGKIRRDKYDAVTQVADAFKKGGSFSSGHAGYNVVRVATSILKYADQPGWFTYSLGDPTALSVPGLAGTKMRELCLPHQFQSFACYDRFESRTMNGPFYIPRSGDPSISSQLYRCEKSASTTGFSYLTLAAPQHGCVALGWLAKTRTVQDVRVVQRCEYNGSQKQEFLAIDAQCPVGAKLIETLGYIN